MTLTRTDELRVVHRSRDVDVDGRLCDVCGQSGAVLADHSVVQEQDTADFLVVVDEYFAKIKRMKPEQFRDICICSEHHRSWMESEIKPVWITRTTKKGDSESFCLAHFPKDAWPGDWGIHS